MHHEKISEPVTAELRNKNEFSDNQSTGGFKSNMAYDFDSKNVILCVCSTPKHHEEPSFGENSLELSKNSCSEVSLLEKSPSSGASGFPHSKFRLSSKEKFVSCGDISLTGKSSTNELNELGNINNNADDEDNKQTPDGDLTIIMVRKSLGSKSEKIKTPRAEENPNEETTSVQKLRNNSKSKRALAITDGLLCAIIVAPLVVGHWRGLWELMDLNSEIFPTWVCFFLGLGVHLFFAILKNILHAEFDEMKETAGIFHRLASRLVRNAYTFIFAAACIMHWRSGWIIFSDCTVHSWITQCATAVCVVLLILLRSVRNLLSAPFILGIDKHGKVFLFPTRFNLNTRNWSLYVLDCAFSVGVIGTLVVFAWRGSWVIFDLYLYPDNPEYSAVGSVVIGYAIVVIMFSLQPVMRYACARLKGLPRIIAVDIFLLISFIGAVNVWRGVWNCLGLWFLPDEPELSCWITLLGCFTLLVLLNCSNSILVRGVYIDAEEDDEKCAAFPCHYLRLFFKIEREKKEARRQNLVVASRDLATITERSAKEENGALLNASDSATVSENPESLV
ncbi:uncharacterized protein LOC105684613 isoform X1 [Athalia rosae]|uniref:uncharacterized protein LOC105684613 isoform X1 n=1 Tax=Athalia rosae TaxID=37344 RepID=UPI002033D891|nr:uncharacterized protein LOC105684613 isoform X1 [Athalia rosae]